MTHIVIHDDTSNVTHYAEFDDVQAAASYLEDLVTRDRESNARLFALEPVEFAVKSYVRVEIGAPTAPSAAPAETAGVDAATAPAEVAAVPDTVAAPVDDTVEYVEAAMGPVDTFAPVAPMSERIDDLSGGEPRRGLFGR
jgi:hypothetical protein